MQKNSQTSPTKSLLCAAASALAIAGVLPTTALAQNSLQTQTTQSINLPAAPLGQAILALGKELGVNIIAPDSLVRGKSAPEISGTLTRLEAIDQLLSGSGLTATANAEGDFILSQQVSMQEPRPQLISNEDPPIEPLISETIVVTGSRIERTAVNSPSPIDIVTADDIVKLGLTDTTEALRFTPALNQSLTLSSQGQFNTAGPTFFGLSTLDLRGLGTNRTLVLVNGRRHVGGVANEATVDVASIPSALIDRVEVLTGGGSSIYGADAVSGVVNYVLEDDFEGVDLRANTSLPTRGDGEAYFAAVTMGGNFSDGRGNAVLSAEYNKQTILRAGDRASSSRNIKAIIPNTASVSAALGSDPQFRNVVINDPRFTFFAPGPLISFTGSSFGLAGQFFGGTTTIGGVPIEQFVDPNTGEIRPRDFGNFVVGTTTQGGDGASTEFSNQSLTTIPSAERYVVNALTDFDFTDQITGFIEVKYSRNETTARANLGAQTANTPVLFENPFIPSSIRQQFESLTAQNLDPALVVTRTFFDDVAAQDFKNTRQTFRVVGGLSGSLSEAFSYEVSANYGRTDTSSLNPNEVLSDRFVAATDVIADPVSGNPICRSDIDADTVPPVGLVFPSFSGFTTFTPGDGSCAPLNIFAPLNALDPDAAAFVFQPVQSEFELEQFVLNATVTGNSNGFLELPAGVIGYALGIEYRDERSGFRPDPLQQIGLVSGSPAIIEGEFDVFEGFAEVSIPIVRDAPFTKSLSIDASIRAADYSFAGSATSYAFGTMWQPTDDLRFRASYNRSIRAPNISELFSPQRQNVSELALGTDPCDPNGVTTGSSNRAQNCAQLVPDPATFDPSPSYEFFGIDVTSGGNPDLEPETADTFTAGFAYTPLSIPGLSIVADYYDIDISGAVSGGLTTTTIVQNCADAPSIDNPFCDAVTRNPSTGVVEAVQATALNVAASRAEGIDYQIAYRFDLDQVFASAPGQLTFNLAGNYLIEREDAVFEDFPETNDRLDGETGFPEHFVNFSANWEHGRLGADYGFTFQSNQVIRDPFVGIGVEEVGADPFVIDKPNLGSSFVHYLGGSYAITDKVEASVRINNLFDREPFNPRSLVTPVLPVSYLGRTVQLGVQAKF